MAHSEIKMGTGYCGEYYDSESGLIYLRARYYDSENGRFISEDPHWNVDNMIYGEDNNILINNILQSNNLYQYANNNPNRYQDTNGENFVEWLGKYLGLIDDIANDVKQVFGLYNILGNTFKKINNETKQVLIDHLFNVLNADSIGLDGVPLGIPGFTDDREAYMKKCMQAYDILHGMIENGQIDGIGLDVFDKKFKDITAEEKAKILNEIISWDKPMYYKVVSEEGKALTQEAKDYLYG